MRTLEHARASWAQFEQIRSHAELKEYLLNQVPLSKGNRSLSWKICLLFSNYDRDSWPPALSNARTAYASLRQHLLRAIENPDEVESGGDPLSDDVESPWNSLRQDEAIRDEILQDVDRTMPENLYFRKPSTQKTLLDILFVFCKLNPDVGYRQGMHEVLAPMLWVIERDAIDPQSLTKAGPGPDDEILKDIFDSQYIEHDTFSLFAVIMQHAKAFYDPAARGPVDNESFMLSRCRRIFETLLPAVDPELATHLQETDVLPQIFLMRWIRLLFSREFPFDDALSMWDLIFLEDPSLELVDYISVSMLLRIRWTLVESDSNKALATLLHYPELPQPQGPQTIVTDAVYLKENWNLDAGNRIIAKYANRTSRAIKSSSKQSSPSRPGRPTPRRNHLPPNYSREVIRPGPSSLEIFLQGAAKSVKSQGEKWGVNKALREAVDDVMKNVQGFQPTRGPGHSRGVSDANLGAPSLENRNQTLAKMLSDAVSELWAYQEVIAEPASTEGIPNGLGEAIAKVQMVQVYLENSSLPLPSESEVSTAESRDHTNSGQLQDDEADKSLKEHPAVPEKATRKIPERTLISPLRKGSRGSDTSLHTQGKSHSGQKSSLMEPSPSTLEPGSQETTPSSETLLARPSHQRSLTKPRQSLAQSSFAWMLEPGETRATTNNEGMRHEKRHAGKGFLFGESDGEDGGSGEKDPGSRAKTKKMEESRKMDEVFHMGEL